MNSGDTPLHCAVKSTEVRKVYQLLEQGTDVNALNNDDQTPLHYVSYAAGFDRVDIAYLLLEYGAKSVINKPDKKGNTILHYAALIGSKILVEFLLEYDADPNIKNSEGQTPLASATSKGHKAVIDFLKDK